MLFTERQSEETNYLVVDNKYLFVGLGNIGDDYKNTRHNAGFMFVDYLNKSLDGSEFKDDSKFKSQTSIIRNQNKIILQKPTTFMNNSGEAVIATVKYFDILFDHIYVIHDDLDINLGEFKIQKGKGPREHNGILSVENHLGTSDFWRIRVGVENRDEEQRKKFKGKDYVLSRLKKEELESINSVYKNIFNQLKDIKLLD